MSADRRPGPAGSRATYRFTTELWRYHGEAAWYFLTVPPDQADEIDERARAVPRGFGSVRVEVSVGATTWSTSLFPDRGVGSYLLPVKRQVRVAEGLDDGDEVEVTIRLLEV